MNRPNPTTGTPTGWTIYQQAESVGEPAPLTTIQAGPVYVICAS
jgi:hypothetical protein